MTPLSDIKDRLTGAAREQGAEYGRQDGQPLSDYARIMGVYGLLVGGIAGAVRISGRPVPDRPSLADVALFAAATYKLSMLLTKDPVTSPLRAPFTRFDGASGPAELAEAPRGRGGRKSVGELVTCPFCAGVWVATGLTAGLIFLPSTTRLAIGALAALAGADLLQFGHTLLERAAE